MAEPDAKLSPKERAQRGNAALTREQRQAAGRARATEMHAPPGIARRLASRWPDATEDQRREVRRILREAGIIR